MRYWLSIGSAESEEFWKEFLTPPPLGGAGWQCCRVHFMRNGFSQVPKTLQPPVSAAVRTFSRGRFLQTEGTDTGKRLEEDIPLFGVRADPELFETRSHEKRSSRQEGNVAPQRPSSGNLPVSLLLTFDLREKSWKDEAQPRTSLPLTNRHPGVDQHEARHRRTDAQP